MMQAGAGVSYALVKSTMRILANGGADGCLDLVPEDYRVLVQKTIWLAQQRSQARRGLQALIYGTMDATGMSVFEVPAEFIAGAIAMFVAPSNLQVACREMATNAKNSATTLASRHEEGFEEVSPKVLYALVLQAYSDAEEFKQSFEKRTGETIGDLKDES